jgi:hypothetical protein
MNHEWPLLSVYSSLFYWSVEVKKVSCTELSFPKLLCKTFYINVECNFFSIRGYFFQDTKNTESEVIGGRVTEIYDPCSALLYSMIAI